MHRDGINLKSIHMLKTTRISWKPRFSKFCFLVGEPFLSLSKGVGLRFLASGVRGSEGGGFLRGCDEWNRCHFQFSPPRLSNAAPPPHN